jgi:hypothetical protein
MAAFGVDDKFIRGTFSAMAEPPAGGDGADAESGYLEKRFTDDEELAGLEGRD